MNGADCATKLTLQTAKGLKAKGIDFVGRYLARNWKGLTADEVKAIISAGLKIFSYYEKNATHKSYFTNAQGVSDAIDATKIAESVGQPHGTTILFAVDYDAQNADFPAILGYFKAVASALKNYEVGAYGEYEVLDYLKKHNAPIKFYSQTYAWSHGKKLSFADTYQYKNGQTLAGISVDFNDVFNAAVAWPQPKKEAPKVDKQEQKPDWINHWANKSIKKAIAKDVMVGHDDLHFGPDEPLTRGQFCVVLDRLGLLEK